MRGRRCPSIRRARRRRGRRAAQEAASREHRLERRDLDGDAARVRGVRGGKPHGDGPGAGAAHHHALEDGLAADGEVTRRGGVGQQGGDGRCGWHGSSVSSAAQARSSTRRALALGGAARWAAPERRTPPRGGGVCAKGAFGGGPPVQAVTRPGRPRGRRPQRRGPEHHRWAWRPAWRRQQRHGGGSARRGHRCP